MRYKPRGGREASESAATASRGVGTTPGSPREESRERGGRAEKRRPDRKKCGEG